MGTFFYFSGICVARQSSNTERRVLHYLDDFLFGGKIKTNHCACIMAVFAEKMTLLGVPTASGKTESPTMKLLFFGLE